MVDLSADMRDYCRLVNESEIQKAQKNGFPWLRFEPELEAVHDLYRQKRLRKTTPAIALWGIFIFLVYCFLDYAVLPESVYPITICIRLFFVCPVIGVVLWVSKQNVRYHTMVLVNSLAYLCSGLAIVAIIMAGHWQQVFLPYDGLLLLLMFGYFLMGLPFYMTVATSWIILLAYVVCEAFSSYPLQGLMYNGFFLVTANVLGCVGHYLHERGQRQQFLTLLQLSFAQNSAERESIDKTRLLAAASHDLRQPLHAMNLLAENLSSRQKNPESRHIAHRLQAAIAQLNHLLSSILDISRLSVGAIKVYRQTIQLDVLVAQVAEELQLKADTKQVALQVNGRAGVRVETDAVLLRRILRNLIDNALEHAEAEQIKITWLPVGDRYRLMVSDDGIGIPLDDKQNIFEAFYKVPDLAKEGMGLGLAIVKQMGDLLQHPIHMSSTPNRGTTFWLDLPKSIVPEDSSVVSVNNPLSTREELGTACSNSASKRRVLIVDDQRDLLDALQQLLSDWGYEVCAAQYPKEAMAQVSTFAPDVVISDFSFPEDEDGLSLIRNIRRRLRAELPSILLTASTDVVMPTSEGILVANKPLQPAKLRLMLQHLLQRESMPST